MSVEGDLHSALMAQVETITGYTVIWPQKGGDKPEGEHLTVFHLPNDNEPAGITDNVFHRRGFVVLTLVSPLGEYEAPTRRKAGEIVEQMKRGTILTFGSNNVTLTSHSVRQGREVQGRWETPIWISYWSIS